MKNKSTNGLMITNGIFLGLLMLVSGLIKLFAMGPEGVSGMLSQSPLFSWAPLFWAWILIIAEIGSGLSILARWKLKYTAILPVIILGIAVLTVLIRWSALGQTSWGNVLFHLIAIINYLILARME